MESDVLYWDDVFRTNMCPIINKFNAGGFLGMIEAMGIAIGMAGPDTEVIPGHGAGFTGREGMLEVHTLLITLRDRVQELIDSGRSLDEVLAAKLAQ